jgi:hypothetical protein
MSYLAQLAIETSSADRTSRRRVVNLSAYVRDTGASVLSGRAVDLSADGCRMLGVSLEPGTTVWIKISGITPRPARVAWARGDEAGCEFESPISEYIVDELATIDLAKARSTSAKMRERLLHR